MARAVMLVLLRPRRCVQLILCTALGLAATGCPASAATLKAEYDFNHTLTSSVSGAPALADVGPGVNTFTTDDVFGDPLPVLAFPMDNGLALSQASSIVPSGDYSILMIVRLDQTSGYRRLVDFTGGTIDNGFYSQGGNLVLYPDATGNQAQLVPAGSYVQIALTRTASGIVNGYVDRTLVLGPYDDSQSNDAVITPANVLRFFIDDTSVTGEDAAGAVQRIRLYSGALTAAEVIGQAPPPPPVQGKSFNVGTVSGRVLVRLPGQTKFVTLSQNEAIPNGTTIDTTHGKVRLRAAVGGRGKTQAADFSSGNFQVSQKRARALTTLKLVGGSRCSGPAADSRGRLAAVVRRHPRRRLFGSGTGSYTTSGSSASATVRGTSWLTEDFCDGSTLVRVIHGTVTVRDFVRHKTIIVRAPHSYLAARRR